MTFQLEVYEKTYGIEGTNFEITNHKLRLNK